MGAELSQLGHPPLPVVSELFAISQFGATCLDDAVEDVTKFVLVCAAVLFCRRWLVYNLPVPAQAVAAAALVLGNYPLIDRFADRAGDMADPAADAVRAWIGMAPSGLDEPPEPPDADVIDDLVEDGFKLLCVSAHYRMGVLLGGSLRHALAQSFTSLDDSALRSALRASADAASAIVAIGTPFARYERCNDYGDTLGDLVQARWHGNHRRTAD